MRRYIGAGVISRDFLRSVTDACKTVGLLQDFSLEPEFGNTGLDLVVWWGIGLESEERRGENSGAATHSSRNGLRTLSLRDSLQGTVE